MLDSLFASNLSQTRSPQKFRSGPTRVMVLVSSPLSFFCSEPESVGISRQSGLFRLLYPFGPFCHFCHPLVSFGLVSDVVGLCGPCVCVCFDFCSVLRSFGLLWIFRSQSWPLRPRQSFQLGHFTCFTVPGKVRCENVSSHEKQGTSW